MPRPEPSVSSAAITGPSKVARRWLLFMHQIPAAPSNLRVRTWRCLQQIGAIPVKPAVYALPESPTAREDFEWLKAEVKSAGGDASVFVAEDVDPWSDDALVEEFRRVRQDSYLDLAEEIEGVLKQFDAVRRSRKRRRPAAGRLAEAFRARFAALERIDFFGSAGRDRVVRALAALDQRASQSRAPLTESTGSGPVDRAAYAGRVWVTRPRPGIDRMSSAWLIRRFIDPAARFAFAADRDALPDGDAIPFDMFGAEFSHQGDGCTFETLCTMFGIVDPAVHRLGTIVHDLDLKDGRFGPVEADTVGALVDGLQLATTEDHELLARGMILFESLYLGFSATTRLSGPRQVAARPTRKATSTRQTAK
jgi:hypothetical protein